MITLFEDVERQEICDLAHKTLMIEDTEDTLEALSYLTETRGLSKSVLEEFRFGYIPRRAPYDWSERIIMPLFDPLGELVVLTSRLFRSNDKDSRPHLHERFDKKRYLFGLDIARKHILEKNSVVVVEGQFDTCCLHSHGIKNAVGVLGSAFTYNHICQLRRYCSNVYLAFDRDKAGYQNVVRAMEMWNKKGLGMFDVNFYPVKLPKGSTDPDDFVKDRGIKEFVQLLRASKDNVSNYKKEDWNGPY